MDMARPLWFYFDMELMDDKVRENASEGDTLEEAWKQHIDKASQAKLDVGVQIVQSKVADGTLGKAMADLVEVKEVVAGPKWSAVTFGEALLSRTVLCRAGACFLAMMPFTKLAALAAAADGPDKALTMTRIADELGSMSLDALEHHGGAYILLRPGEGAMLPAGWIYMQCGLGYMQATRAFYKEHQLAYDCGMSFFAFTSFPKQTLTPASLKRTQKEYDAAKLLGVVGATGKIEGIQRHFDAGWSLLKLLEFGSDIKEEQAKPSPSTARDVGAAKPAATMPATVADAPALILDYSDSAVDFAEFFNSDGADLAWEVARAKSHERFHEYVRSLADQVDEDWQFGDMEGDAFADLEDFVQWLQKGPRGGIVAAAGEVQADEGTGSKFANDDATTKKVQADEGTEFCDGNNAADDTTAKQVQADEGTGSKLCDDAGANEPVQADEGTGKTPELQLDYGKLPQDFSAWFQQHGTDLEWEVRRARSHAKFALWVTLNGASDKSFEDQPLGSQISWLSELHSFLTWLPMIAPSSPREPATPQLERHEYVLRAGAGKSDLSKLADAAGDQAAFDAIEPEHIKSQPLSGLSESEKVMAEVRHRVLQGKAAAAQDKPIESLSKTAPVPSIPRPASSIKEFLATSRHGLPATQAKADGGSAKAAQSEGAKAPEKPGRVSKRKAAADEPKKSKPTKSPKAKAQPKAPRKKK
eukprot:s6994_g3.t1